jgi:hypothetical protein
MPYLKRGYRLTKEELPYVFNDTNFEYIKKTLTKKELLKLLNKTPVLLEKII